ncbi:MAG: hypothetical protein LBR44_02625 [Clostridiales Family XIII bacterium]|jgi:hypothetical protein|nr:hypothetical protein [Clostridiales Family XIII bacterium]
MRQRYKDIEKVWLICVVLFYFLYNLPGVPPYGDAKSALIHGGITVIGLWVSVYVGLFAIYRHRRPRSLQEVAELEEKSKGDGETKTNGGEAQ